MKIVSNSTPLIYLAKLGKLNILKEIYGKVVIPEEVYQEVVVRGKEEGYSDALSVEVAVKEGWIERKNVKTNSVLKDFAPELDMGEIAVLMLAEKYEDPLLLIDDASGRSVGSALGFRVRGTIYVLLKGFRTDILSKAETKDLLDKLISKGFRLSPEIFSRLLKELDRF